MSAEHNSQRWKASGFHNEDLNTTFVIRDGTLIAGKEVYWAIDAGYFMYWQHDPRRYAITPEYDDNRGLDMFQVIVQAQGSDRGIAVQHGSWNSWIEFVDDAWVARDIVFELLDEPSTRKRKRDQSPKKYRKDALHRLSREGIFSDVQLVVGAQKTAVSAVRILLAAASDVFEAMFSSRMRESCEGAVVEIPDLDPTGVKAIVDYAASGIAEVSENGLLPTFLAARKYNVVVLYERCVRMIHKSPPSGALQVFDKAISMHDDELISTCKGCRAFSAKALPNTIKDPMFKCLASDTIINFLKMEACQSVPPDELWNACFLWAEGEDQAENLARLPLILPLLPLQGVGLPFLAERIKEGLVPNDMIAKMMLLESYRFAPAAEVEVHISLESDLLTLAGWWDHSALPVSHRLWMHPEKTLLDLCQATSVVQGLPMEAFILFILDRRDHGHCRFQWKEPTRVLGKILHEAPGKPRRLVALCVACRHNNVAELQLDYSQDKVMMLIVKYTCPEMERDVTLGCYHIKAEGVSIDTILQDSWFQDGIQRFVDEGSVARLDAAQWFASWECYQEYSDQVQRNQDASQSARSLGLSNGDVLVWTPLGEPICRAVNGENGEE